MASCLRPPRSEREVTEAPPSSLDNQSRYDIYMIGEEPRWEGRSRIIMKTRRKARTKSAPSRRKQVKATPRKIDKNSAAKKIRLLIADDHALILEGLAATIGRQSDMAVVAKASNGREAVELWKTHRPDVSLLDLRMPMLNGVGVIKELRDLDVAARIIVHTTYDTDEEIYQAVRAGAKAYLLKDAPLEELLDTIRKVHAGQTCIPPALAGKLASRMSGEALTIREVDVLKLLATDNSSVAWLGDKNQVTISLASRYARRARR
jgi:DNA-binding NarL/FixJ family response regulator